MDIQKLKAVIQAANPSIMDLKFGCEAEQKEVFITLQKNKDLNGSFMVQNKETGAVFDSALLGGNWKILGRPIRLADVLVAIGGSLPYHIGASHEGRAYFISNDDDKLQASWNLLDDNLDNQSPKCKQFLYNLLVK